jgi:hypothetical protein
MSTSTASFRLRLRQSNSPGNLRVTLQRAKESHRDESGVIRTTEIRWDTMR